jgi:hypothetical protein
MCTNIVDYIIFEMTMMGLQKDIGHRKSYNYLGIIHSLKWKKEERTLIKITTMRISQIGTRTI